MSAVSGLPPPRSCIHCGHPGRFHVNQKCRYPGCTAPLHNFVFDVGGASTPSATRGSSSRGRRAMPRVQRKTQSETDLSASIDEALSWDTGVRLFRNNVGARRIGGRYIRFGLRVGSGDRIGIVAPHGRFLSLEVKQPKEASTPEQNEWRDMVNAMGGVAAIVRSVDDARAAVARAQAGWLHARVLELEAAIRRVLEDEESRPGGWGPDVTMVAVLRDALGGARR